MAVLKTKTAYTLLIAVSIIACMAFLLSFIIVPTLTQSAIDSNNKLKIIFENEDTMKTIMLSDQLQAVNESIHEYFGDQRNHTMPELFQWQNKHLIFLNDTSANVRPYGNPKDILEKGVGKCGEYSILFTAACICSGYNARLAVVMKSDYSQGVHDLCLVKLSGVWTQVDSSWNTPSKLVVNETSVYQTETCFWGPLLGKDYSVFAFDETNAYNVTELFI